MKRNIYIAWVVFCLLFIILCFSFSFCRQYIQKSSSMYPSVISNDRVFVVKSKNIHRFDIVSFNFKQNGITMPILKRVIALPGESIEITNGEIKINNKIIQLPSTIDVKNLLGSDYDPIKCGFPSNYIVPAGEIFVIGDNTKNSYDSRYFGGITIESIIGRATYLLRLL